MFNLYLISLSIMTSSSSTKLFKYATNVETTWTEVLSIWLRTMLMFWKCPLMVVHFANWVSQPETNWCKKYYVYHSSYFQHFSQPLNLLIKLLYLQEGLLLKLSEHTQNYLYPFGQEQHRSQISLKWRQCLFNLIYLIISGRLLF